MAIEFHKCNKKGCNGEVAFENADFDIKNPDTIKGVYAYSDPKCTECGKEFLVVPHWSVVSYDEETGDYELI
jgi:hypothetical protein